MSSSSADSPRVTFWIHGGAGAIEGVRARGISRLIPGERLQFLHREGGPFETRRAWMAKTREFRPDLIYVLNTASPGAMMAAGFSRKLGIPYVLDTGDAVYAMARSSGIGAGWRLPLLWWFENRAQRRAHTVVVRGTQHREHLRQMGLRRVELIRDGYSEQQEVPPSQVASLRERVVPGGGFVVGVMGSLVWSPRLQMCYGWDLIRALALLRDRPVTGLVIGDGNGLPWLRDQARMLGVEDRVHFAGRVPYAEVPAWLRVMDVALSTQTNNLAGRVRTTGKLPEYMASGRFILASRVGDAATLLPEIMLLDYEGARDAQYPARLADRVRRLFDDRSLLEARQTLPAIAARHCSYAVLQQAWLKVVQSAVAGE